MSYGPRGEVPPILVVGPFFIAAPLGLVLLPGPGCQGAVFLRRCAVIGCRRTVCAVLVTFL